MGTPTVRDYRALLARPMTWRYVLGEVKELWEELLDLSWAGVIEEWGDVALAALAMAAQTDPDFDKVPITRWWGLASWEKFTARTAVWEKIFAIHNIPFEKRYLADGSNFRKKKKVAAALAKAGLVEIQVNEVEALLGTCLIDEE